MDSEQLTADEVHCPACGSSFHLDRAATTDWKPSASHKRLGKFELIDQVGMGAFGTVYKARDTELDRIVAIKVPRGGQLGSTSGDTDRFMREARSVAQLRHPSIVAIHEVGQHESLPFLVADFVAGVTLADLLTSRRLPPRQAAKLIAQVADALEYAHSQGVVHRDVKPSNIMLSDDLAPHVMDFGLAKRDAGEITMTLEGQVLGTPAYTSPEQARGESHKVDGRSDVYSLGVILYELLAGELPFRGNVRMLLHQVLHDEPRSLRSLNDRIPRDLEIICLKAMAKEPARRYASARELAEELRRWLAGEPIRARSVGPAERVWRWCRRNRAVASLIAVVAGVLVIATAVSSSLAAWALKERSRAKTQADAAASAQLEAEREAANATTQEGIAKERAEAATKQAALVTKNMQFILDEIDLKLSQVPSLNETRLSLLESIVKAWDEIDASVRDDEEGTAVPTLMVAREKMARVFLSLGKLDLEDREYRKLYDVAKHRISVKKGTDGSRYNLAMVCNRLGESSQQVQRDMIRSREYFEEALGLMRDIQQHPKPDPKLRGLGSYLLKTGLGDILQNLGVWYLRSGQLADASRFFEQALSEREQLLEFIKTDAEFAAESEFKRRAVESSLHISLDKSFLSRAEVFFRLGETASAEKINLAALEHRRQMFEANPRDVANKVEYARFSGHLGLFYFLAGSAAEGRPLLESAVAMLSEASADNPNLATFKSYLHTNRYRLGCLWDELGDAKAALGQFQECRKLSEGCRKLSEDWGSRLMLDMARCGEVDAALQRVHERSKSANPDAGLDLDRARALAQCSRHALSDDQRRSLVNAAFEVLDKVVKDGYRDSFKIRTEPDFKPLRDDPRFSEVLAKAVAQ